MYGVCMVLGVVLAGVLALVRCRQKGKDGNDLIVIGACALLVGLMLAKLLYLVVSYGLGRVMEDLRAGRFDFLGDDGLVFYGGLIGGIVGAFAGVTIVKGKFSDYCDVLVPCVPLGHAFGRLGCFFGGCCYGMPYEGVGCLYLHAAGVHYGTFPVQLLEMVLNLGICAYLLWYTKGETKPGHSLYRYLLMYALVRFGLEFLRGDLIRGVAAGLSTSQWISIVLGIVSLVMMIPQVNGFIHRQKN